jgi:hypothetical protein
VTFDELRAEYEQRGIGDLIYGLVVDLSGAICRKYPESVYNSGLSWDQHSIADLAQEVVINRLIDEGQLDYIFTEARNTESVRRLITRQVKRELHRRRPATPIDRLLTRIEGLAASGDIEQVPGATPTYRPVGSTASWAPLTPRQETDAANAAAGIPILYSRIDATRESQIYTTPALRQALAAFFTVAPALSELDLRKILERVLTPWTPTSLVPIESSHEIQDDPMIDDSLTDIDEAAGTWVGRLSTEECWVYYLRSLDLPDSAAADRIGKSRTTVINIKQRVLESAGVELLADLDPRHHLDAVRLAQEHCARRLGEVL